jgi:serine-type D-Ala-D-Ala carboxypeptidase (penicillin-binding protein 5/6)
MVDDVTSVVFVAISPRVSLTMHCKPIALPVLFALVVLPALMGARAYAQDPVDQYPRAAAAYAVAIDDQTVWGRDMDKPRPPASLTKLLSALVILDNHWQPDATVTVSAHAAGIEGSRIRLRAGDRVRAGDLLTGMIVRSGNDACMAMAEHVGGTADHFVEMMNAKARELGMTQSSFRNPCGLDAQGHVSTPRDLLLLARAAADRPEIAERANALHAEFRTLNGRRIRFKNTNAILGREPDVAGLKTGFTRQAGKCLIALAEHGAHRVWVVLLHSPDRWFAATDLLAQGMALAESRALSSLNP